MTQENIQMIIDLILQWGPAVVSIITMICTVIVAIKKVSNSNDTNLKETRQLEKKMGQVLEENAELKKTIRKIMHKIYHVKDKEE